MDFTHFNVNWIGVVLAAVASMIVGMVWYMGLSKHDNAPANSSA